MNRRNFLGTLIGGVAAAAAVRTWPFRVYSFPKQVSITDLAEREIREAMEQFRRHLDAVMYADGVGFAGLAYHQEADYGTWMGLKRSTYSRSLVVSKVDHRRKTITLVSA